MDGPAHQRRNASDFRELLCSAVDLEGSNHKAPALRRQQQWRRGL